MSLSVRAFVPVWSLGSPFCGAPLQSQFHPLVAATSLANILAREDTLLGTIVCQNKINGQQYYFL
jgi:hypothetical protein